MICLSCFLWRHSIRVVGLSLFYCADICAHMRPRYLIIRGGWPTAICCLSRHVLFRFYFFGCAHISHCTWAALFRLGRFDSSRRDWLREICWSPRAVSASAVRCGSNQLVFITILVYRLAAAGLLGGWALNDNRAVQGFAGVCSPETMMLLLNSLFDTGCYRHFTNFAAAWFSSGG